MKKNKKTSVKTLILLIDNVFVWKNGENLSINWLFSRGAIFMTRLYFRVFDGVSVVLGRDSWNFAPRGYFGREIDWRYPFFMKTYGWAKTSIIGEAAIFMTRTVCPDVQISRFLIVNRCVRILTVFSVFWKNFSWKFL